MGPKSKALRQNNGARLAFGDSPATTEALREFPLPTNPADPADPAKSQPIPAASGLGHANRARAGCTCTERAHHQAAKKKPTPSCGVIRERVNPEGMEMSNTVVAVRGAALAISCLLGRLWFRSSPRGWMKPRSRIVWTSSSMSLRTVIAPVTALAPSCGLPGCHANSNPS